MKHRLPDGSVTTNSKKYVAQWERVGEWLVDNFFPGHYVHGFDPGFSLHSNVDWGPHQNVSLRMPTIIALAYSDAAQRLPTSIRHLLPKETPPAIEDWGYKHADGATQLVAGDTVYLRGEKSDRWYKNKVIQRLYTPYNSHYGYLVTRDDARVAVGLQQYGTLWSVHPEDHFLCVKLKHPPFKVSRGKYK